MLGKEGMGFKIAMGAFDKTRPPVSRLFNNRLLDACTNYRNAGFIDRDDELRK